MKIYVVTDGHYDAYTIQAMYTDHAQAIAHAGLLRALDPSDYTVNVEEWGTDGALPILIDVHVFWHHQHNRYSPGVIESQRRRCLVPAEQVSEYPKLEIDRDRWGQVTRFHIAALSAEEARRMLSDVVRDHTFPPVIRTEIGDEARKILEFDASTRSDDHG